MADRPLSPGDVARLIDISAVQAPHRESDVRQLAEIAVADGFEAAHVLGTWVPLLVELLDGTPTRVGAPVGYPSGGSPTVAKVAEAAWLVDAGVDELDVVIAIGRLRSGHDAAVRDDLRAVVDAVAGRAPLRAILETAHLDDAELRRGTALALEAGISALKTGTGWAGHATSAEEVAAIRDVAGPDAAIKAAGGVRSLARMKELQAAGATRFGVNTDAARRLLRAARGTS